ncbi:hypothetical protein B0E38_06489 [Streptomyces sp. 111WW2]|nr:hypothetical protein B0E38_06489 [Streptomyces sp. 111WW2]
MSETWPYLLTAIVIIGLGTILGLAWLAFLEGVLRQRHKD